MSEPIADPDDLVQRADIASARRVVVKVGSSSLTSLAGGLDVARLEALVQVLADQRLAGKEIVFISSGAVTAGLAPLGLRGRPRDLASRQAAAAVGMGLLMERYAGLFGARGIRTGQVLLTLDDVTRQGRYRNVYRSLAKLLELGVVPVVNENDTVAASSIRFGDNDRLAALVAHLVHADALVLLSDVDALYTDKPGNPGARPIADVTSPAQLDAVDTSSEGDAGTGTGGMETKVRAARVATSAGIPTLLTDAGSIRGALNGDDVGTLFQPMGKRRPTKLLWLAYATDAQGSLTLDEGAVSAVRTTGASLLPVGVTAVEGTFDAGDPINLLAPDGTVVARGLSTYPSRKIPEMLGRSTDQLAMTEGPAYERTLVHRDVLVLL